MKITFMEAPETLTVGTPPWDQLAGRISDAAPDILVGNELPFGPWLAQTDIYDPNAAAASISAHDAGLEALASLGVPVVLASRPVAAGPRMANEAFTLIDGIASFAHHKHFFPQEPGYYEASWFHTARPGFDVVEAGELKVGFMICTEIMFTEWARHYRRQGAQLIAVPRASTMSAEHWKTAASMAALVSGCYVVSSNRAGTGAGGIKFGGVGFAFAPDGTLIAETSADHPVATFDLDVGWVRRQQKEYPCYVKETGPDAPWFVD